MDESFDHVKRGLRKLRIGKSFDHGKRGLRTLRVEHEERKYWLGFSVFPGIGPHKFALLLEYFSSAQAAWKASLSEKQDVIGKKLTEKLQEFQKTFDLEKYVEKLEKNEVEFVTLFDEGYPERLKQIPNPPFVLYVKGDQNLLKQKNERDSGKVASRTHVKDFAFQNDESIRHSRESGNPDVSRLDKGKTIDPPRGDYPLHGGAWIDSRDDKREGYIGVPSTPPASRIRSGKKYIAVVGTRRITSYGQTVTRLFTERLVAAECVIVSGLALGVDAVAHETTIENQGKTIAVLGCGVDCCSPRENQALYNSIISSGGAIISEYPLGATPTIGSFPARNRIVAGMSDAVLVTEGAEDSGALITADFALEFGRSAFAVPGPITSSLSKGPFKLIAKGGKLVTSPEEMLEELQISPGKSIKGIKSIKGDSPEEQKIIDLLSQESLRIDELTKRTGIASATMSATLSLMEIKGIVAVEHGEYTLAHIDRL